ncbi:hypothetical protein O0L34_g18779 [Tuta absoluta]|nr:hypothetical protein O0L34_g18779 [Tuta absoluta]
MNCTKCNEELTDGILCSMCGGSLHFGNCSGVAELTHRRMTADKKGTWRCPTCRISPNPVASGETKEGVAAVLQEIREFRADFVSMRSDIDTLKSGIESINDKYTAIEKRFSDFEDRIIALENKSDDIATLTSDLVTANDIISTLQHEYDTREQYSRMNNVEISGLPFKKGENLMSLLNSVYMAVGLDLDENSIDCIQRVRRFATSGTDDENNQRSPAVIVKFTRRFYKDQLLSAVRARRGITTASIGLAGPAVNLYLGDHLTPNSKQLLKRARQLKKDGKLTYLWIRDCKILARKTETSKVMLINKNFNFDKIM